MTQSIRISLPGYDALTEDDIYRYSIYADSDNVLIKEKARGGGTTSDTASINHSLGYIPFYLLYTEVSSGRFKLNGYYDVSGGVWRSNVNTTTLEIETSMEDGNFRYYIFYDDMDII